MTTSTSINTLVSDLLSFNGTAKTEFNRTSDAIQKEIDSMIVKPTLELVEGLNNGTIKDITTGYSKAIEHDALSVLTMIIDKASNKSTRDNAVSDFVKRVNRTFKKTADTYAETMVQAGHETGVMDYPNLGRSITDNVPVTKWSTKELTWSAIKDKEGKIKGAKTTVTSASQSNRSAGKEEDTTTQAQGIAPKDKVELLQAIQYHAAILGLDLVELAGELLTVANSATGTTFKVAKGKATKAA